MVWEGGTVCNKCVYACGTIPPVFWYNYPNCAPQITPQGKRSHRGGCPYFHTSKAKLAKLPQKYSNAPC